MKLNHAINIIRQELNKSGYEVSERPSVSTSSIYFKIQGAKGCSLLFRVADHTTHSNVITLRVDHKLNENSVRGFVKNRLNELKKRELDAILGNL